MFVTLTSHLRLNMYTLLVMYLKCCFCCLIAPRIAPVFNATALNSTAIMVKWILINDTREVIDGYMIMWHRHKHNGAHNSSNPLANNFTITGLRKYTNYTITVSAYNSMGVGPSNESKIVQTKADGELYNNTKQFYILARLYYIILLSIIFLFC